MDPNSPNWQEVRALIIGRAYPEPSKRHVETVCTGALTEDGELLRLYPVSLRYLNDNQRYKLWTWISVEARKNPDDSRSESYKVREDSIKILADVASESERLSLIGRAMSCHREELEVEYHTRWTSMGIVPIEITRVTVKANPLEPIQVPPRLDMEVLPLDAFPADIHVDYRCRNNAECKGHGSTIIAWEYAEAFRKFKQRYAEESVAVAKLKSGFEQRFINTDKDVFALVGTHSRYPTWMIGQLYAFDKNTPGMLF